MVDITDTDKHLYEIVAEDLKDKIKEDYFGERVKFPIICALPKSIM